MFRRADRKKGKRMTTDKDRQRTLQTLAGEISALLARGLPQDQATLDTVLAALGETDPRAALALLAADPEASEHAPLLALLLSPAASLLRALEPALQRADLDAGEARELAKLVAQQMTDDNAQGRVPTLLPDGSRAELTATAEGLRAFVRRLRPEATAPAELRSILARNIHARRFPPELVQELAQELAVLLRHCRLAWTPGRVFFLATLLERANSRADSRAETAPEGMESDDLPGLLAWAAGFLEDLGPGPEPRPNFQRALAERRQALLAQLRQAEFMEEAFARGNFETLLSQGMRFAHVHGPDVRAELAHLERAGRLALGLAPEALDGVSRLDLGQAEDAQELLRLLPGLED